MSRFGCTTPTSCHPYLLIFGLLYVALFIGIVIIPDIFDRADWNHNQRQRGGPIREDVEQGEGDRVMVVKVEETEVDEFKAVAYEDVRSMHGRGGGKEEVGRVVSF